jgi:CobQ-like glutamine amidotransferase family enzyme
MIRLGILFPKHLNLNGDFGNVEVLARQFEWRGHEVQIVEVLEPAQFTEQLNFVLIGHGSEAAWSDISDEFRLLAPQLQDLISNGVPVLAVSTGFEKSILSGVIEAALPTSLPERVSKFSVVKDGDIDLLGYVNVDTNLPEFYRSGSFIGTALHGPVLSKNPMLLDQLLADISQSAGVALQPIQEAKKADQLADLIAEVWKLESELANE